MSIDEQKCQRAIERCHARWLEPDEPVTTCVNCGNRIRIERLAYKHEPVCSQTCWNELLERDR